MTVGKNGSWVEELEAFMTQKVAFQKTLYNIVNIDVDDFDFDDNTSGEIVGQIEATSTELAWLGVGQFANENGLAIETLALRIAATIN